MASVIIPHMNGGKGKTSYATNSLIQQKIMLKVRPFLKDSAADAFSSGVPSCVKLADLGCSSESNALSAVSEIIHSIHELSKGMNCKSPEFQVFLNDLPGNDFNNIFRSLLTWGFYEKLRKEEGDTLELCFITGVPGSFYNRIFPSGSLDFVHSSCSVSSLSQAPAGLEKNRGHICIANGSPPSVIQAYATQFQRDISLFLGLRSQEIKPGGGMVITLVGRKVEDPIEGDCSVYELLSKSLVDTVAEGLIEEADLNSFNLPIFIIPQRVNFRLWVQKEGSFNLDKVECFEVNWDPSEDKDRYRGAQNVANYTRSVVEPMLTAHFGGDIIDDLFPRYADRVAKHLLMGKEAHFGFVISLTKR